MTRLLLLISIIVLSFGLNAQIVSLQPTNAGPNDQVTLIFDASEGNAELANASKIYVHHGVVTDSETGTDWKYVKGNWGTDDGVGLMTRVTGETSKWQITFTPTLRQYFGVPTNENIFRISAVFRSTDGNTKGTMTPGNYGWGSVTSNGDFYINLNVPDYVTITSPSNTESYLQQGQSLTISAIASSGVSSMSLLLDEGEGYTQKTNVTTGNSITYNYIPTQTVTLGIQVTATINGVVYTEEKNHQVILITGNTIAQLPQGLVAGINYHDEDNTKVTLVLEAPGKNYTYVVGDFSNWLVTEDFKMNQTPDGEHFWIEIDELEAQKEYVYQYWIDGKVKVGDPYAEKIADPWNDKWIEETEYPNLPEYNFTQYGPATVFQTGQTAYQWSNHENTWQHPDVEHLMIYELHIRDFLGSHSYTDLIDTISYLKRLGVDAIELMPINEFEGNDSWGYNPAYYFAPDKYYGTKNDLKRFIDVAHQNGMAVILDMVLNHAFGQNPMVRMYWDETNNRPAADNPWFNATHVGQYQWGYDFNHESEYTKRFIDRVNTFWLEEYRFDGYRFDFTKGFTNYAPGGSVDGFDQSRINILKRMADVIWESDHQAYVILEHWGPANEESILADYGMKMWSNRSYDFVPAVVGANTGSFNNLSATSHVSFFNSHDERRIAEHALTEGLSKGNYSVKDPLIMFERVKMSAAFAFLNPGPKMMWQFDELGYDIHIDYNGRVGRKPLPWGENGLGYYEDQNRQYIYDAYQAIIAVRKAIGPANMAAATTNHKHTGNTRRLSYNTTGTDLVVIGNFGLENSTIDPAFTQKGKWYNYFTGEEITVTNMNTAIELKAGEWHLFTTERLSNGLPGVVEVFDSPVTISPSPFTMNDEITITFDAAKAWNDGTNGLVGATAIYLHAGLITDEPRSGNLTHNKIGLMTKKSGSVWEIKLKPSSYFGNTDAFQIGMHFADANNTNVGKGFRNSTIYADVQSQQPLVTINPAAFKATDEITITFNAAQGNRELIGAGKVYMHSSVGTENTDAPQNTAWNHAIGNWGKDDGIGEMTQIEENVWQINLIPQNYYGLASGEFPYWLAAVFRNAAGNIKGTGAPGDIENGFIASNLDIFIRNQMETSVGNQYLSKPISYPNPTSGILHLEQFPGKVQFKVYNTSGQLSLLKQVTGNKVVDISVLPNGLYIYTIETETELFNGRLVKY